MRKLVIAVVVIELAALTVGGAALASDRELMDGLAWTRAFKAEQPVASRAIVKACTASLATSANLNRDGALRLHAPGHIHLRREVEAQVPGIVVDRAQVERVPERRPVLAVVQKVDMDRLLRVQRVTRSGGVPASAASVRVGAGACWSITVLPWARPAGEGRARDRQGRSQD